MEPVSRRSVVRGAALVAPALVLAEPHDAIALEEAEVARLGRGCAPRHEVAKLLVRDMSG
jgi:hypothetical protein